MLLILLQQSSKYRSGGCVAELVQIQATATTKSVGGGVGVDPTVRALIGARSGNARRYVGR
jgi:hypothetical protein